MNSDPPELVEIEPRVLTWSYDDSAPARTRYIAFVCFGSFGWILIGIACVLAVIGRDTLLGFGILAVAFVVWTVASAFISFVSVRHFVDGIRNELRRTILFGHRSIYTSRLKVDEGDSIVICQFRDREHGGSQHRVYLRRRSHHYFIAFFRVAEPGPSAALHSMCDSMARVLRITNAGYIPYWKVLFSLWTSFRWLR